MLEFVALSVAPRLFDALARPTNQVTSDTADAKNIRSTALRTLVMDNSTVAAFTARILVEGAAVIAQITVMHGLDGSAVVVRRHRCHPF